MIISPTEYNNQVTNEYCELIQKYTLQLFTYNKENRSDYRHVGSSVLLNYNSKKYLLTAGHVLKWFIDKGFGILEGSTYHEINGKYYSKFKENEKDINNCEDIGIIELDRISVNFISKHYQFLDSKFITRKQAIENSLNYLIFGFPLEKTKYIEVNRLAVIGWKFLTKGLSKEDKEVINLKEDFICGFYYDQKNIINLSTGELGPSPKTEGLSGCGIWFLPKLYYEKGKLIHPFLTGINFGHDNEFKYIFGHKLSYALEKIKEIK